MKSEHGRRHEKAQQNQWKRKKKNLLQGTRERTHGTSDLTLLFVKDTYMGSTCGVGQYLWSTTFPVAIVDSYCLGTDYITAHEFGHNLGARHNQEKVWATEQRRT